MDYYFTFGQAHCQNDGSPMKDFWVRVTVPNSRDEFFAKRFFLKAFMVYFMPHPFDYSWQYREDKFEEKDDFPKGEYMNIIVSEDESYEIV